MSIHPSTHVCPIADLALLDRRGRHPVVPQAGVPLLLNLLLLVRLVAAARRPPLSPAGGADGDGLAAVPLLRTLQAPPTVARGLEKI